MATNEKSGVLKYVNRDGVVTKLYPNTKKNEKTIVNETDLKNNTKAGYVVDALVVKDIDSRVEEVTSRVEEVTSRINGIELRIVDGKLQYRYDQEVWN